MTTFFVFFVTLLVVATITVQSTNGLFFIGDVKENRYRQDGTPFGVRLKVYTGPKYELAESTDFIVEDVENILDHLDPNRPTALYIHGFKENLSSESIEIVVGAYLERGDHNIITVDWSDFAFQLYPVSVVDAKRVAQKLAYGLEKLVRARFDIRTLHVIGHSLGAQIAGLIGKQTHLTIPRITGLDPAGPLFDQLGLAHLNSSDAQFVDVIHTDGGIYGTLKATGTVDFYANGGYRPQPNCALFGLPLSQTDLCSHVRSWRIYAETLRNEKAFLAVKCGSHTEFLTAQCRGNDKVHFGIDTPINANGLYYFTTNPESPFGRGYGGVGSN